MIFGRGLKLFPSFCGGMKILRVILMGYKTMFLENIWVKSTIKDLKKSYRHLEMMNHLTSMKIAWDNLVSVNISMY